MEYSDFRSAHRSGCAFARWSVTLLTALVFCSAATAAVPVIPGAAGFGINTPAGRGGTIYRVTNLNTSGAGSLGACASATGPRVCIFEVSGTIVLSSDFEVRNPFITIAGQTAPAPGIMLRGGGLRISTSDVLVQHLRVRVGDAPGGYLPDNRDALKIESPMDRPIKNIVVDHCSFSWSIDEMASIYEGAQDVSLINNIFSEPLNDSLHSKGPHGYGILFGPSRLGVGSVMAVNNLLAHQVSRNPLSRANDMVFANNVVYNRSQYAMQLSSEGTVTDNSIVGNVFVRGPDHENTYPSITINGNDALAMLAGSRIFVSDNLSDEMTSDPWSIVRVELPLLKSMLYASSAPAWPTGLTARPVANNIVLNYVLANAGARRTDRDSVDERVVQSVKNRTGRIINCVAADGSTRCSKNGGGWPTMAQNSRTLSVPANPNQVGADGYTNLEKWLQDMAAEVEGRTEVVPRAPTGVQIQ